jgi:hypothetical protein
MNFVNIFHSIEIVLVVEQKKHPIDIKQRQEVEVAVTEDGHEAMSENAGTKSVILS